MKGQILSFTIQDGQGLISGDDGVRYTFAGSEWRESGMPLQGESVDFEAKGTQALAVYRIAHSKTFVLEAQKSKVAAGIFAILLGWLGVHKFYLGHPMAGIVMLIFGGGFFLIGLCFFPFLILSCIVSIIAIVEGILYLTKTDEVFHRIYVMGRRGWF